MTATLHDAVQAALKQEMSAALEPGLYLVATPIGNLADMTLRGLSVLARANTIYCEDTRHSRKLLSHYQIDARLNAYHEHNGARERPNILQKLNNGEAVALISDAGTPLVSDPGYKLVAEACEAGHAIRALPGPSALLAGLTISGLPTDSFFFAGFLPPRAVAARKRLEQLADIPATLIFFETAKRLNSVISVLSGAYPGRDIVIARELTKRFEEVHRTCLPVEEQITENWRGEFVVLISPPIYQEIDDREISEALERELQHATVKDAVEEVKCSLSVPRKRVYDLAIKLQKSKRGQDDE